MFKTIHHDLYDNEVLQMTEAVQNVSQPQIQVENLNLWYGEKQALKNVSMHIPKNSVTALIGPSG